MRYNGNQRKGIGKWVLSILLAAFVTLSFVPEGTLVLDAYAKESALGEQTDAEDYVFTIVDDESGAMEHVWPVVTVIIAIATAAFALIFLHEKRRGERTPSRKKRNKRRTAMPERPR